MRSKILAALLVITVLFNLWLVLNPPPKPVPEVVYITIDRYLDREVVVERPVYVTVEKLVYIDKPTYKEVEKPVYVDKPFYTNIIWSRSWESVRQFTDWYLSQGFALILNSSSQIDCDDYATLVSRKALEQGYQVSLALTWWGKYYDKQVTNLFTPQVPGHAGSLIEIQGIFYYFEPRIDEFKGLIEIAPRD